LPKSPERNKDGWPKAIAEMVEKIRNNTKTNIANVMYGPFSTSGITEKTAFAGTLMETMKHYFEYKFVFLCGIPKIYLLGTVEDYEKIVDRIDQLAEIMSDFHWFLHRIRKRMIRIGETAKGKIQDDDFWSKMIFQEQMGSGGETKMTGWLADFIPYLYHETFGETGRKQNLESSPDFDYLNYPAASSTYFQLLDYNSMTQYDMKLITGFFGPAWDENIGAIRPAIGWATGYTGECAIKP